MEWSARIRRLALLSVPAAALLASLHPALAGTPDDPDLRSRLADYDAVSPAPRGIQMSGRSARMGHLELRFSRATLFPLVTPRGAILGFFCEGSGRYEYRTEDPIDREAAGIKLAQISPAPAFSGSSISDSFQRMVLFTAAAELTDLLASPGAAAGEDSPELGRGARSDFQRIWSRLRAEGVGFSHLAAEARTNLDAGRYIRAQIEGRHRTVGYVYDTLRESQEFLGLSRRSPGSGAAALEPLSQQPIAGELQPRYGSLSLRDVRIEADFRSRPRGTIVSDLGLEVAREGVKLGTFYLTDPGGGSPAEDSDQAAGTYVRSVTDGKGRQLLFSLRGHELLVELADPVSWGETLRLRVETQGESFGPKGAGPGDGVLNLVGIPWFPVPSGWSPDGFTLSLRVRTRKPLLPVATGRVRSLLQEGDEFDLETESLAPVRRAGVMAGPYQVREARVDGHTVRYYALDSSPSKLPDIAGDLLGYFEKLLGPYPYGDLDIIETQVPGFGAALPGMVLMPGPEVHPRGDAYARYLNRGIPWRLAHEIARQWFGQMVFPAAPRDLWLSDSIAEYLANLASARSDSGSDPEARFDAGLKEWWWEARGCRDGGSLAAAGLLTGSSMAPARFCLLYNRGPLVLQMLRNLVGEEQFVATLKATLLGAQLDLVSAEEFQGVAEREAGAGLGWFMDDWVRKPGMPEILVTTDVGTLDTGGILLTGRASQSEGPAFRRILVPLVLDFADGHRESRTVFLDRPFVEFRFELSQRPQRIGVDPEHHTLAIYP